ncbi:serine hydrolase [Liquorilactobacillus oeni]|uniref:Beta-lactamase class A n=1 Tax=Liquorilactobacillus oeni DSM 19972 TaxID=1423777 RepID=A0A0R1MGU3_9LACO|nr:serine hydrolase [Liquorilactobacillus oeni]KRL04418.1 Beta-lactamase class A [Liquorilactobacillus oeni DSM 19972]
MKKFAFFSTLTLILILYAGTIAKSSSQSGSKNKVQRSSVSSEHKKQNKIKNKLQVYLNSVTADGTASVSFYNLSPVSGSKAAAEKDAATYTEGNLAVSANANSVQTSASTYKLFITAYLMEQKKKGNFSWTEDNTSGFKSMIIYSENDYAEEQLAAIGSAKINKFIANENWYSPVFSENTAAQTTALSLTNLLLQLHHGTGPFSNSDDRKFILNLMGSQVYRTGIPTGAAQAAAGTTVQDKVGFLNDVNNDAGIVTLPNGQRYVLVIMTHGHNQSGFSGFSRIAAITKKIQSIVYGGSN